jgi:hypothetical protein
MKISKINYFIKKHFNIYIKNGQSTIEFIMVLPFVIIISFVFLQLGYLIYLQNNIEQSAREAARIIATTNSNDKAAYFIRNNLTGKYIMFDNICFIPGSESERRTGEYIKVKISIKYGGFGNILESFTGKKVILNAESTMRMECGNQDEI